MSLDYYKMSTSVVACCQTLQDIYKSFTCSVQSIVCRQRKNIYIEEEEEEAGWGRIFCSSFSSSMDSSSTISGTAGKPIKCRGLSSFFVCQFIWFKSVPYNHCCLFFWQYLLVAVRRKTAAVCRKAGAPLSMEEIEVQPPKAWEVRIKILCTSLCHSDLTTWKLEAVSAAHQQVLSNYHRRQFLQFSSCTYSDAFSFTSLLQGPFTAFPRIFGHEAIG